MVEKIPEVTGTPADWVREAEEEEIRRWYRENPVPKQAREQPGPRACLGQPPCKWAAYQPRMGDMIWIRVQVCAECARAWEEA